MSLANDDCGYVASLEILTKAGALSDLMVVPVNGVNDAAMDIIVSINVGAVWSDSCSTMMSIF